MSHGVNGSRHPLIELTSRVFLLAMLIGAITLTRPLSAQTSSTVIKVLDPSEIEGIAGVMLLVNPGDSRKSQALVTDEKGEAIARDLDCVICTIRAFDPHGSFVSRTTGFSGTSSLFRLVLAVQPLLDVVGDPKAVRVELGINNSKGEPLVLHEVVIRPTAMTLEDNRLSVERTDATGRAAVQLRAGKYTIGVLNGDGASEVRFEITATKEQCSESTGTCIVVSPQSSRATKAVRLQLSSTSLR